MSVSSLISIAWKPFQAIFEGWNRFWFTPADPTSLGFMRISCGLVVLFIHFAYTWDLQEFFGKNAWVDLASINEYRLEQPWQGLPWGGEQMSEQPPAAKEEEAQFMLKRYRFNPRLAYAKAYPPHSTPLEIPPPP